MPAKLARHQGAYGVRVEGTRCTGDLPLFGHAPTATETTAGVDKDPSTIRFEKPGAPAAYKIFLDDEDLDLDQFAEWSDFDDGCPYGDADDWPAWADAFRINDATPASADDSMWEIVLEVGSTVIALSLLEEAANVGGRRR